MKKVDSRARYFETNEWARPDGAGYLIGITDFAQTVFGEVTYIELPDIGQSFQKGTPFAITESNKASNEVTMPLSGKITSINSDLLDHPEWLNDDPYGQGWLVKIIPADSTEWGTLMGAKQYQNFIGVFFNKQ